MGLGWRRVPDANCSARDLQRLLFPAAGMPTNTTSKAEFLASLLVIVPFKLLTTFRYSQITSLAHNFGRGCRSMHGNALSIMIGEHPTEAVEILAERYSALQ